MRIYSLSVILGEDNTVSLHTNFQLVVNEVNTILAESDPKYKEALKAWIQNVFDRDDISVDTIGQYLDVLSEIETPSITGFLFKNYFCETDDAFWVIVNCTVHEAQLTDHGALEILNLCD